MNILVLTADYPPIEGGIGTVALHTSRELAAAGHAVTVVAPRSRDMDQFDLGEPVKVVRYPGYNLGWFRFIPLFLMALPRIFKTDLILGINIAYGGVIGYFSRRPYVTFAYAYEFLKFANNPVVAPLLRRVYARSRLIVAISSFTYRNLVSFGVAPGNVATIFPGAPPPRHFSKQEIEDTRKKFHLNTKHVILSVARFVKRKGHDTLIKALPSIIERYPDTVMMLVGRGPRMDATAKLVEELDLADHVRITGRLPRADIDALYQICELFALPTGEDEYGQVEGFGLVFSEAHSYGKPVVAGHSGGVVDAVHDGINGVLVDLVEPEQLAEAILGLMDDPRLAHRLGLNGKKRVEEELNWRHFVQRILEELENRP